MIRFEAVSKNYGTTQVLQSVTLQIAEGTLVVISGHSGAGKSTLLKLIPLIVRPSKGAVFLNGQNVSNLKTVAVPELRRRIGFIFQEQRLLHDRSVFDNVLLPLSILGYPPKEAARRVRAALDKVGLLSRERAMPVALSGGEQQRLAIARAVVNRPSLLIADEPSAHLDPDYARDIASLFYSFHQVGTTVVVVTHDTERYTSLGAHKLILNQGMIQ